MSDDRPILLVANALPPLVGGTPMVYDRLARACAPRLHVLTAWRDADEGKPIAGWRESDAGKSYPIHRIAWLRPPRIEAFRRRIGLLDLLLVDLPVMLYVLLRVLFLATRIRASAIVVGELQGLGWLAILLGLFSPWRIILYTHGEEVVQKTYNRLARLRGPALRAADHVITVSSFTRDRLMSDFGVAPERIDLVTPGVDLDRFQPGTVGSDDKPFVLAVGRLIERKGFDRLIEAFALIAGDFPEVDLVIAGKGPEEQRLRALAAASPAAPRIRFRGAVDDATLVGLYGACTLFAMPNRTLPDGDTEGFGLIFLEANACGKAVIGGRAGGATDAVVDGVTGLLVDGDDPASIAAALRRLLSDPDARVAMEQAGLARARTLGWDATARRFLEAVR
ncbi:glycosyltransferase family 4 protein [Rhizorhabdus phycosphaerae]|uniref:glycosyltransferase family 4 protein n=1 Tax=Rhizorhabdus phycosphaerae TaxID=2711156 RepID=UPI001D02C471|nr:glycosyltransferase family 4 protein [Rhizorhabdus phycosphaerae]